MALKGCFACMKYLVVVFNLIFWLVGIGVIAVSVWLYIDGSLYLNNVDDSYMYYTAIYILMAAGAVMFLIGLLGCCGALQESPCMLGTFFMFLLVIFTAEVSGGVWTWLHKNEVNNIIEVQLTKMVKDEYGKYGDSSTVDKTIDIIQHDLQCCGGKYPSDWAQSRLNSIDKAIIEVGISDILECYSPANGKDKILTDKGLPDTKRTGCYKVPKTCCATKIPQECAIARNVPFSGSKYEGLYNEGCVPKLQHYFQENMLLIFGIGIGIGAIQILGLIFSLALCCAIRTEDTLMSA